MLRWLIRKNARIFYLKFESGNSGILFETKKKQNKYFCSKPKPLVFSNILKTIVHFFNPNLFAPYYKLQNNTQRYGT